MKNADNNLQLPADPIDGLLQWLKVAEDAAVVEPTAMTLATVDERGRPSARMVLFKGLSESSDGRRSPRFFTNYTSRKSQDLSVQPRAALVFFWGALKRQIRVEGPVEKTSYEETNVYFQSRPRGSQIGAWASPQSRPLRDRTELENLVTDAEKKFAGQIIPCPPHWGGWRVVPERIEFWHGIDSRLHDRFVFEWQNGSWISQRLAP